MSRIYDDKPLSNLPLIPIELQSWDVDTGLSGDGVLIEGIVRRRSKVSINCKQGSKTRYYILNVEVKKAHRRKFDSTGKEINPNFSETQKINKGYLNTYKVEAKGQTDKIETKEVEKFTVNPIVDAIYKKTPSLTTAGCLSLWLREDHTDKMEIDDGDSLRITTKRNSPFIENITKMERTDSSTTSNYAGEDVGAGWTGKIMEMKRNNKESDDEKEDENNDDEWDD